MADTKISNLAAGAAVSATNIFPNVQTAGVGPVKTTAAQLATYFWLNAVLVNPALGTPSSGVATNLTGTAAGLTAGNVTTNANLTGDVTSVGNATTIGATKVTSTMLNADVFSTAHSWAGQQTFVAPILGTPASGVGTNLTGTAAGLTAGTVTTNANLTGHVTSVGNAAVLGSFTSAQLLAALTDETGTGSAVFATSPTFVTPTLGVATSTSIADAKGDVRLVPQNSQSVAYTTVLADAGKHILHPAADTNVRTFTIDSNVNVAYTIGTAITFVNQTSQVVSIAITSDTMTLANSTTTGTRSLAQNGIATALKISSTGWIISGTGLT